LADAVRAAQEYTWNSLAQGFRPGMGQHVPNRLWRITSFPAATVVPETADANHACVL
jgi:hydroxymethylpyrimidine/phosphomethylpyrimidine kinase